jgi:hypothetical protein
LRVVEFEKLRETQQQAAEILGPIAAAIPNYRDTDPKSRYTPWEKAWNQSFLVLEDYDGDIHDAISGIDLLIRAYHATRLRDVNVLQTQGLLRLGIDRVRRELLLFAEQVVGKTVPQAVVQRWIEETEEPTAYLPLRAASTGPVFSLGVAPMFQLAKTGRYFIEGGEIIYHIAPVLSVLLRTHESSFTMSDQEFWEQYWAPAAPALVICDLRYDGLLPEKQGDIRRCLVRAALYQDSTDGRCEGGWIELSADQDIPPEWIVNVLQPDIDQGAVSFGCQLDLYRRPTYWEL